MTIAAVQEDESRPVKVGEYVLPPSETGSESASDFGAQEVHRKGRVYVSTALTDAQLFASGRPEPIVYEVEPDGEIEPDPDCKSGVSLYLPESKDRFHSQDTGQANQERSQGVDSRVTSAHA